MLRAMNRANVIAGVLAFAFAAFVYWLAGGVPAFTATDTLGGRFFPRLISVAMMIASLGLIVTGLMGIEISGGTAKGSAAAREPDPEPEEGPVYFGRIGPGEIRLLGFIAVLTLYTLILPLLGYIVASVIVFAALIALAGERRPLRVALGAASITALLYTLFAVVFRMNVPTGTLF